MRIEKPEESGHEGKLSSIYDKSIKALVDFGISLEDAYDIIHKTNKRFYQKVAPDIILRATEKAVNRISAKENRLLSHAEAQEIFDKMTTEIVKQFRSDPKKKEKTIYKGPGEVELKESSNN
jgi:hypothetical protein